MMKIEYLHAFLSLNGTLVQIGSVIYAFLSLYVIPAPVHTVG
jgi:hypothetical protein